MVGRIETEFRRAAFPKPSSGTRPKGNDVSRKLAASRVVRKSADDVSPATAADIERLRAAMQGRVDTGDIAERRKFQRIQRGPNGRLPPRKSLVREAVMHEMQARGLTAYRLWQLARIH
jgi:hypothetical protein